MKPWKRGAPLPAPVGPRGYTSFDPRDPEREERITAGQRRIVAARDRLLGWREGVNPTTPRAYRFHAAWWRLESMRDYGVDDRTRSASYAANMLDAASLAMQFGPGTWLELQARAAAARTR